MSEQDAVSGRRRCSKKPNASSWPRPGTNGRPIPDRGRASIGARRRRVARPDGLERDRGALRRTAARHADYRRVCGSRRRRLPKRRVRRQDSTPSIGSIRPQIKSYQPYWAVRAHLLRRAGRVDEALGAYDRAIGLTEDAATRQFLLCRRAESGRLAASRHARRWQDADEARLASMTPGAQHPDRHYTHLAYNVPPLTDR